uniref:Amino acid transporter transmembrane domain-containing protein n=1 Tax=Zooxanthella nutricula TaxID=1333877 RepID=A0A7S2NGG8_9DINO|mmetsp:Transcript_26516/g.79872  ORF Transcript_26516/g.79872 Transcript_26516/m.79872 type:complete len:286 (-) Transcript_26516:2-859(-)
MIFVAQIVGSMGVGDFFSVGQMFAAQLVFLIPLSFIRNLHRLEVPILGADVLIFFGLVVVLGYSVTRIAAVGAGPGLQAFRPDTCGLFIGTATFTFEGIPMVLPIKQSMAEPQQYWALFVKVFSGVVMFFVSFALIGYVAFGDAVHSIVILDLPAADPLVQAVKAAYACALILGSPLTFLPGGRITELWVFGESRQKGQWKWQKNALRTAEFCAFAVIGVYGGQYFEKFIALTGALCCAPIALIYPPLFHWRLCASSAFEKIIDAVLLAIGCAVGTLVFYQAVAM